MIFFEEQLEKQEYYNGLQKHKERVSKFHHEFNTFESYHMDSVGEFLEDIYEQAMINNGELQLSGKFIG